MLPLKLYTCPHFLVLADHCAMHSQRPPTACLLLTSPLRPCPLSASSVSRMATSCRDGRHLLCCCSVSKRPSPDGHASSRARPLRLLGRSVRLGPALALLLQSICPLLQVSELVGLHALQPVSKAASNGSIERVGPQLVADEEGAHLNGQLPHADSDAWRRGRALADPPSGEAGVTRCGVGGGGGCSDEPTEAAPEQDLVDHRGAFAHVSKVEMGEAEPCTAIDSVCIEQSGLLSGSRC